MDPTFLIEGVGGGAAAVGVARRRRRAPRVRRDPIDVQLVAAEMIEADESLDANEILAALEAQVSRAATQRTAAERPAPAPAPVAAKPEPVVAVAPAVVEPEPVAPTPEPVAPAPRSVARRGDVPGSGIAPDQVREWMSQVQEDLRKVRARVEYLRVEQARLEEQQRLMAQLITSSTPL